MSFRKDRGGGCAVSPEVPSLSSRVTSAGPAQEETMRARSGEDTLRELRSRGARRLKSVNFRANRSTIWSLTQDATVLNLHVAYRRAPASVLDAFATIVRGRGWKTVAVREASEVVHGWPGLTPVLEAVRTSHAIRLRQSVHLLWLNICTMTPLRRRRPGHPLLRDPRTASLSEGRVPVPEQDPFRRIAPR